MACHSCWISRLKLGATGWLILWRRQLSVQYAMWWNSGPHLRRRMLVESGMGDSYRTSQSFFSRCSAVDEFKDAPWLQFFAPVSIGINLSDVISCNMMCFSPRYWHGLLGARVEVRHLIAGLAGAGHRWQREDGHARVLSGPDVSVAESRGDWWSWDRVRLPPGSCRSPGNFGTCLQALNRMGYVGNIRTLWHLLDSTNAGAADYGNQVVLSKGHQAPRALSPWHGHSCLNWHPA